jgi:AraC-like DNA-binding protein
VNHILRGAALDEVYIQETLMHILANALDNVGRVDDRRPGKRHPHTRKAHAELVYEAQSMLTTEYRNALSIEKLADSLHVSPYHLCRVFRRETGLTIHRYLNQLRMHSSLERISRPDEEISRVALDLGYASHSHFTQTFNRTFGLTPSALRV